MEDLSLDNSDTPMQKVPKVRVIILGGDRAHCREHFLRMKPWSQSTYSVYIMPESRLTWIFLQKFNSNKHTETTTSTDLHCFLLNMITAR